MSISGNGWNIILVLSCITNIFFRVTGPYKYKLLYRNNNIIVIKTFPSSFLCKSRYMNLLHGSLFMWKTYNFSENSV